MEQDNQATQESTVSTDAPAAPVAPLNGKENTYFFKTVKLKDADGKEIGDGFKHPDVKVLIPTVNIATVLGYLQAGDGTPEAKVRDMIMDTLFDQQVAAGRKQINDWLDAPANKGKNFQAINMDMAKLGLQAIADTPKGQRGAWAPDEADFKAFNQSYTDVLVHKLSYDPERTKVHTEHFKLGFTKVRNEKPVIEKLKSFLIAYAGNMADKEEEFKENFPTYEWLVARADKYLKMEEKDFLSAL